MMGSHCPRGEGSHVLLGTSLTLPSDRVVSVLQTGVSSRENLADEQTGAGSESRGRLGHSAVPLATPALQMLPGPAHSPRKKGPEPRAPVLSPRAFPPSGGLYPPQAWKQQPGVTPMLAEPVEGSLEGLVTTGLCL